MPWTKEKAREYARAWYHANKEEQLARAKARHKANPIARASSWRRCRFRKYGLTLEKYEALLQEQDNRCAICGKAGEDAPRGRLCVDHDHRTQKYRALLCGHCNTLIGHAFEDTAILAKAASYLERFSCL